jgi:hypothetical protein
MTEIMTQTKPKMEPGGLSQIATSKRDGASMPIASPPANIANAINGLTSTSVAVAVPDTGATAPSLLIAGVMAGISIWQNDKRIDGLWCTYENRNSWVDVVGIQWKKLANNSDSAIVAFTMLSAHAREKGAVVNYREENDGMIREMYVW